MCEHRQRLTLRVSGSSTAGHLRKLLLRRSVILGVLPSPVSTCPPDCYFFLITVTPGRSAFTHYTLSIDPTMW